MVRSHPFQLTYLLKNYSVSPTAPQNARNSDPIPLTALHRFSLYSDASGKATLNCLAHPDFSSSINLDARPNPERCISR